jgi:enoyl-CoA hydratase/carnithine racemase
VTTPEGDRNASQEGPAVVAETRDLVGIARINRAETRNALAPDVMEPLAQLVEAWDADPAVNCIVIAGGEDFFAAGADIRELRDRSFQDTLVAPGARFWSRIAACRTPLIAAVSGYALGGGCELAMLCDVVVASSTAEFGQPEIMLGIIPGGGGTQRLARVVGKHRAMEIVLTGRRIGADEAYRIGLVNRVTGPGEWLEEAVDVAQVIARRAPIAARLAKQAVLAAFETGLSAGLDLERRLFELAMATEDRVEGTSAFLEKRRPEFRGR